MLFEDLVRLDDPEPHSAALNMAIDEALLRAAEKPLLRCYRWERAATSFGYFGKHADVARQSSTCDLVRRWTGGGVVPHGEDFTYSLIIPRGHQVHSLRTAESYRAVHAIIADVLGAVGRGVSLADSASPAASAACFESPVQHDLLIGAIKVAGAAQRRTQYGLLHQGSIQMGSLPGEFGRALASAFATQVSTRWLTTETVAKAEHLVTEKYGTDAWLRRA